MKKSIFLFLLLLLPFLLFAGDIAAFVNLGFSNDARFFMFAQYGINSKDYPYAEIYTVDVRQNKFTQDGVKKAEFKVPVETTQDGSGALYSIMKEISPLSMKYDINHLKTGRILYILLNGEEPKQKLQFRDFNLGNQYSIELNQSVFSSKTETSSAFHITMAIEKQNAQKKTYTVGLPDFKRKDVKSYKIRQIIIGPDEKSLIFIVEKEELAQAGNNIRYMVETVFLQ
ncbi:MAG: DUF2259 domain-containing protein [Spirochaetales bacterium]|nr:MAG: DUF2259 domain-containing protein [Spirochaetales bacterium]